MKLPFESENSSFRLTSELASTSNVAPIVSTVAFDLESS
jgi:hypothetical protein